MKQLALSMFAAFLFLRAESQEKIYIPAAVTQSFSHKYPTVRKVHWLQDDEGVYAARFYQRGEPCTMRFDAEGRWLDGVKRLAFGDLRNNVRNAFIQSPFASWQAYDVSEIQLPDKESQYRIHIRHASTQTEKYLYYNGKGRLMKQMNM
jgi:hypothetical protein